MQCALHMGAVIKRTHFDLIAEHYDMRDGTVIRAVKRERLGTAGVGD